MFCENQQIAGKINSFHLIMSHNFHGSIIVTHNFHGSIIVTSQFSCVDYCDITMFCENQQIAGKINSFHLIMSHNFHGSIIVTHNFHGSIIVTSQFSCVYYCDLTIFMSR